MENGDPNRINPNAANFDIGMIKNEKLNDPIKYKILPNKWSFDKDYIFPKDKNKANKAFNYSWLTLYSWLRYSISDDGCYCIYCLLFQEKNEKGSSVFANVPFRNWANLNLSQPTNILDCIKT